MKANEQQIACQLEQRRDPLGFSRKSFGLVLFEPGSEGRLVGQRLRDIGQIYIVLGNGLWALNWQYSAEDTLTYSNVIPG
jgi:hypothetical protein